MMGGSPLARRHCGRTAVRTMLLFDLFVTQAMVDTLERVGTAQAASVALKLSFTRTMEHALRKVMGGDARALDAAVNLVHERTVAIATRMKAALERNGGEAELERRGSRLKMRWESLLLMHVRLQQNAAEWRDSGVVDTADFRWQVSCGATSPPGPSPLVCPHPNTRS